MRSPGQLLICILGLWVWTAPLMAGGVNTIIIDGRKAHTSISLPKPGGGNYTADFELEFHNPVNLTSACLGISAEVLDAAAIASVQARLPDPVNQTIDPAFPVKITVEPPAGCGLEFEDEVDIELDTADLVYTGFSPYRLMKAPVGSSFRDITASVTAGSVRSRGSSGTFSEFVMVLDAVQAYATEAQQAFDMLDAQLANIAIGPTAKQTLQTDASVSRSAVAVNDYAQAIARLDDLTLHCGALGGPALPNRWRSLRDLQNVEGEIVGQTDHLKFLLGRLNGVP
ncbi:MAG: DUF6689 family protein [Lysobacterales bacterium]